MTDNRTTDTPPTDGDREISVPRELVERAIQAANMSIDRPFVEVKISDKCLFEAEDCDRTEHPGCGQWGGHFEDHPVAAELRALL